MLLFGILNRVSHFLPPLPKNLFPRKLIKARKIFRALKDFLKIFYSSEIAPTGQPAAHAPQLKQASGSMLYWVSP